MSWHGKGEVFNYFRATFAPKPNKGAVTQYVEGDRVKCRSVSNGPFDLLGVVTAREWSDHWHEHMYTIKCDVNNRVVQRRALDMMPTL